VATWQQATINSLLPLPFLMYFLPARKKEEAALRVPFFERAQHLQEYSQYLSTKKTTQVFSLSIIWCGLVLAAANPQWIGEPVSVPHTGRDLLMAVDISGSMEIPDIADQGTRIDRLTAVKKVVGDFIEHRKNDRMGLVLFGSNAYLQAPLTYDTKTVNTLLQEALIGFAGDGTAIGDAIGLSIKRLLSRPDAQRVLVLLTDGQNTDGELDPKNAADIAQQNHVKIYTIGFGSDLRNFSGQRLAPIDEPTMMAIAEKTGGHYFRARNINELNEVNEALNSLEPIEVAQEIYRPVKDLFYMPLAISFLFSLSWALFFVLHHARSLKKSAAPSVITTTEGAVQ
jgi:Ca-activated chloride channel homolog